MAHFDPLQIRKGEDKALTFNYHQNITGWTLSFEVKVNPEDAGNLIYKTTTGGGVVITGASTGLFSVTVLDDDTTGLNPAAYLYRVRRTDPGFETVMFEGPFILLDLGFSDSSVYTPVTSVKTITSASSPYTVLTSDNVIVIGGTSAVELNLYRASDNVGKTLKIYKLNSTPVTLLAYSGEYIGGNSQTSYVLGGTSSSGMSFAYVGIELIATNNANVGWAIFPSFSHADKMVGYYNGNIEVMTNIKSIEGVHTASVPWYFRNLIVNPTFREWDRGTSFAGITAETRVANGWLVDPRNGAGSGTASITQLAISKGAITGYEEPYQLRWVQSIASTNNAILKARIEGANTASGRQLTLSGVITGSLNGMTCQLVQNFGTGGSPSTSLAISPTDTTPFNASTSAFSRTFVIPTVAGKTFGTNNDSYLEVRILMPASQTWDIACRWFQLEFGVVNTILEIRPYTVERALCNRYLQWVQYSAHDYVAAGQTFGTSITYSNPPMRAKPTIGYPASDPGVTTPVLTNVSAFTPAGAAQISTSGFLIWLTATATSAVMVQGYRSLIDAEL